MNGTFQTRVFSCRGSFSQFDVVVEKAMIQRAIGPHEDLLTVVETHTEVVWSCLSFIRSGQNHLARHSERGKKTRQTDDEVGREYYGMDRP